jgi:hypothetical protein
MIGEMRSRWALGICLAVIVVPASYVETATAGSVQVERWITLDGVSEVGRIDWTCNAGKARTRFVNSGPTTSRIRAFVGAVQLRITATLQPRDAIEMPFGQRVQRWRVRPISESLPESVNFRVRPVGPPCAIPVVLHDFG